MCLWLVSNKCKGCADIFRCLCNCAGGPVKLLLNLLVGMPLAFLALLASGLGLTLVHLVPGSYNLVSAFWAHVCIVIKRGKKSYNRDDQAEQGELPPPLPCDIVARGCTATAGECCCCLTPVFLLVTPALPMFMLFLLLSNSFIGAIGAACGSCGSDSPSGWWKHVSAQVLALDRQIAATARRPNKAPVCTCLLPAGEELRDPEVGPPAVALAVGRQQPAPVPVAQAVPVAVARPVG